MTKEQKTKAFGLVSCVLALAIAWVVVRRSSQDDAPKATDPKTAAVAVEPEEDAATGAFEIRRASWGKPVEDAVRPELTGMTAEQMERERRLREIAENLEGLEVFVREGRRNAPAGRGTKREGGK